MSYKFRNELISSNKEFKKIFNNLLENGEIREFPKELWEFINRDKSSIVINNEPFAFKDLFHLDLNEGRCKMCAFHLVMLLDKFGIYSEAVGCVNNFLKGTSGSTYGGHFYVEVGDTLIDTSLVIIGSSKSFLKLGHIVVRKYDIDTIFKQNYELIDYYDNMIIRK